MTTSPTPATPSPEQKLREAISTAIAEGIFAGEITATSTVSGYSPGFVTRILSALQSSGCLKAEGAALATLRRVQRATIEHNATLSHWNNAQEDYTPVDVRFSESRARFDAAFKEYTEAWNEAAMLLLPPTSHQPSPSDEQRIVAEYRAAASNLVAVSGQLLAQTIAPPAPISSAPDGAGTKTRFWTTAEISELEQQRDALKRDLGLAQARIKELEAK